MRPLLLETVKKLGVQAMIDAPCGAMVWMPLVLEHLPPDFRYLGLDITRSVIQANRVKFASKPNWRFDVADLSASALPRGYDLVFTRDALQHLDCRSVVASLRNIANSGAKHMLVGSYDEAHNVDIAIGGSQHSHGAHSVACSAASRGWHRAAAVRLSIQLAQHLSRCQQHASTTVRTTRFDTGSHPTPFLQGPTIQSTCGSRPSI